MAGVIRVMPRSELEVLLEVVLPGRQIVLHAFAAAARLPRVLAWVAALVQKAHLLE